MAALILCPQAGGETGTFFLVLSAGAEFAPFLSDVELKDGPTCFSVQESSSKVMMLVLPLVWISAFCQPSSGGLFVFSAPKKRVLWLIILKDV